MSTDNIEIKDWQDEMVEKDIISTAWQAEFFGPEEKVEDEAELDTFNVHVIYKKEKNFTWYYPQIKAALLADAVKEFVEFNGIVDATEDDIEELKAFFFHYLRFVQFDVDLGDVTEPGREFEPEGINEQVGEDDLDDIVEELQEAGMEQKFAEANKPQLH
jgi:hypothetical protein